MSSRAETSRFVEVRHKAEKILLIGALAAYSAKNPTTVEHILQAAAHEINVQFNAADAAMNNKAKVPAATAKAPNIAHTPKTGGAGVAPNAAHNPTGVTTHNRLSVADAEKLFKVPLQENYNADPSYDAVQGIKHVASVIGYNTYGWDLRQDACLINLWTRESGWRGNAYNDSSALGIPQAMQSLYGTSINETYTGDDSFKEDVISQVQWGEDYIHARYGSPCVANDAWYANWTPKTGYWY
jgi:hypothetical protein